MDIKYYMDMMSQYNDEELQEIIISKKKYNKKCIEASGKILEYRSNISKKVIDLDDDKLLEKFYDTSQKYDEYGIYCFLTEFEKRNIEPKMWYFRYGDQEEGPLTATELKNKAKNGLLDQRGSLVRRTGLSGWYPACEVSGLFDQEFVRKKTGVALIIATVIMFISALLWLAIGCFQISEGMVMLSVWDILVASFWIYCGYGTLKRKGFAFKLGIIGSVLTAVYNSYILVLSDYNIYAAIMIIIPMLIITFMVMGRKHVENAGIKNLNLKV
jgi:hypothetical protein